LVATSFAPTTIASTESWLALALTPGLGPTRARKLAEHFGGAQNVFKASLTELEAAGIRAASAQALGTGRSAEFAQQEITRAAASGVRLVGLTRLRILRN
jgi:DNA processing protein